MSQWGEPRVFGGMVFRPHVAGAPFEPLSSDQIIDHVLLVDVPNRQAVSPMDANNAHSFIGKRYADWLGA